MAKTATAENGNQNGKRATERMTIISHFFCNKIKLGILLDINNRHK